MIELKNNQPIKEFQTFNVFYSRDGFFKYTEIKTYNGTKLLITNTTRTARDGLLMFNNEHKNLIDDRFITVEIVSKIIPNKLQDWVDKYGITHIFYCDNQKEVEEKYMRFIEWIKNLRSNRDRSEGLIQSLKEQIEQSFSMATIVLLYIYKHQTKEEQNKKETIKKNWKGFTSRDAKFMSNVVGMIQRKNDQKLQTVKQEVCNRTKKYAAQYLGMRGIIENKMYEVEDTYE